VNVNRQFIGVIGREIVPHIVIARTAIALEIVWKRRKNSSRRKRKEPAIGDRVDGSRYSSPEPAGHGLTAS